MNNNQNYLFAEKKTYIENKNEKPVEVISKLCIMKAFFMILFNTFSSNVFAQPHKFINPSWDLRPQIKNMGLAIRNQEERGTCTLFALAFLIEYNSCKEFKLTNLNFSEEYLNAVSNRVSQSYGDGSKFPEAVLGYGNFGVLYEQEVPYKGKSADFDSTFLQGTDAKTIVMLQNGKNSKFRFLDSDYTICPEAGSGNPGLTDAQMEKLQSYLDRGIPVGLGFAGNETNGNFQNAKLDNGQYAFDEINLKAANGGYAHSIAIVGYKIDKKINGGGYIIFRNCGGESWGYSGYGYMTFNFVKKYSYDFLAMYHFEKAAQVKIPQLMDEKTRYIKDYLISTSKQLRGIKLPYLSKKGFEQLNASLKK